MNNQVKIRPDDTRERIVETAFALFRRFGYAKTAVADIASELGMSPANVYRFFPSKIAIVQAICQRCLSQLDDKIWAVARGRVLMAPETARQLRELPKGDAIVTAQLAGIMAAKRTSELIPLCHPLPLSNVGVEIELSDASVEIEAVAETTAQTGVEMEALLAASVAALTVYDMAKAIDKEMTIADVRLVEKTKAPV